MSSLQIELFKERNRSLPAQEKAIIPLDLHQDTIVSSRQHHSLENALDTIFVEPKEETRLARARRILGNIATEMNDDELISSLAQFQHLLESWFDDYEKLIFKGKTLNQILNGG
ncbi:MAG: hypothetical protein BWY19_00480 [bacterium ADurb.Bin212]|nr:MAG: hypothetical protein BWY19_00480 [bacterium ADurb.Bin212]